MAGDTLANLLPFAKLANISPHQSFPPYGIIVVQELILYGMVVNFCGNQN